METYKGKPNNLDWDKSNLNYGSEFHDVVPLYLHPAELTDFEIKGVMALDECWIGEDCSMPNMIAFARAILRKTKEK